MYGAEPTRRRNDDSARTDTVDQQLAAYGKLVEAIDGATSDPNVTSALEAFEPLFLNNLTLALDHSARAPVRMVTGKGQQRLNEVGKSRLPDD